ncbi:hypothetical protein [Alloalcanivorax profundimaris]|uniref:hypothetical protein n=1 Tax=Alloalcanivorax profundimaris TaxID=2735259 RepID=UPI0018874877|nr:hypothetical protein [Alloalcanivorax profundimaris]MBF1803563.1 hypothetical protein [Alloalcanivorax profundimaris]
MALAGKSLSLSFSPVTQEDEDTLVSYLPDADADEDGKLDPGELPDILPGHLINLKARFSIGSETVANPEQEPAMGSGLASEMGYWQPGRGWDTSENKPIAGEFRALALDLQGISGSAAEKWLCGLLFLLVVWRRHFSLRNGLVKGRVDDQERVFSKNNVDRLGLGSCLGWVD